MADMETGRAQGRPVLGALAGFLLGLALAVDLLLVGVLALDSIVLIVLPLALLVVGAVVGLLAPLQYLRRRDGAPAQADVIGE